ncbi:riboflavin kinase [Nadsonia fulvescens var. elongata DSM 6958]|uniref:Riboflavin kinase n=1 Tax=Nadsonia fulvescens var. elongata DSM 6958 TaxID=857566 RepID=A0A1E3PQ67_9ASCO|nr:riboflavin kinase [Nadsonia fulvescens var. elongata DSM 6958]
MTVSITRSTRTSIVGEVPPQPPYPAYSTSTVIPGYGRGSSDLGIPTANIPIDDFESMNIGETGIYFGWVQVIPVSDDSLVIGEIKSADEGTRQVEYNYGHGLKEGVDVNVALPMVMSVGWNPFYHNKRKSGEIHIMHEFGTSFYGAKIKMVILGYIRPELDYVSIEALIDDINVDINVALNSLERESYSAFKTCGYFCSGKPVLPN